MHKPERSVSPFDVDDIFTVRPALGGEALERPAVLHQHLFDGGLMERCVHRLTEP